MTNPRFAAFIGLVLVLLAWHGQADDLGKKYSIESRYAYAMGYRVGQSMQAQGVKSVDVELLAQGVNDMLQGDKRQFEQSVASKDAASSAYVTGYRLGQSLKAQGIRKLDVDSLVEGISDPLHRRKPRLSEVEMNDALNSYLAYQKALLKSDAKSNLAQANAYLESNAARSEVVQLDSGLQYEVLRAATGARPNADDTVLVHYQGSFIDGEVFDSSLNRGAPARFALDEVVPGFRQALTHMQVGEKWRIHMPPALGYGARGVKGVIGANELLIFDLELVQIVGR